LPEAASKSATCFLNLLGGLRAFINLCIAPGKNPLKKQITTQLGLKRHFIERKEAQAILGD